MAKLDSLSVQGPTREPKQKVKKDSKFSWKRLFITIILVLLTAGVVGGAVWYYMDQIKQEKEKTISSLQSQMDKLSTILKKQAEEGTKDSSGDASDTDSSWKTYKNTDYDFEMTLTDNWKGYKVAKKSVEGATATYYFGLPTTGAGDEIMPDGYYSDFAISVYTKAQWTTLQASENPTDTFIAQNDKYVLAWSHAQSAPEDATDDADNFWHKANADVNTIIKSVKFSN